MLTRRTKSRGLGWSLRSASGALIDATVDDLDDEFGGQGATAGPLPDNDEPITEASATTTLDDGWSATVVLSLGDRARLAEVKLRPPEPIDIVGCRQISRYGLASAMRQISRELPLVLGAAQGFGFEVPRFTPARPGRGGHEEAQYALWARDYVAAVAEDARRPIALLVERNRGTTAAGWRRWLAEAEKRKLLADRPTGTSGRAGGRLTAKATRLIEGIGK